METQQFCLKWNSHQANMLTVFEQLLSTEALVDVTLACDGLSLKAHKVVLSACSPYFQSLFVDNPCKHPIVIMKDMRYSDLKAIIDFMYKGEVNVSHDQLNALLKTAETLKVKGLAEMSGENRAASAGAVQQNPGSSPPTNIPVTQTRSDSPAMLSKRKHGRPRKRFRSGSVHSDEEIVPTKIKEPESPEIEELPQDPSESISDIPLSSKHSTPVHSSAAVNNSHLSRKSQSSRSSHQTEEPPSESDFSIEPSKLMEQTLTTTPVISNGLAQSSSSGISVNTPSSLSIVPTSLSIVPASCESQLSVATDSHSSNQTQGPDSPQDVKPLLSFEEPLISVDPSQDGSSFMDSSGVPSIAGTSSSYQEDQTALVPQDSQSQGFGDKLKPKVGSWECTSCLVSNVPEVDKCAACEATKHDSVGKHKPSSLCSNIPAGEKPESEKAKNNTVSKGLLPSVTWESDASSEKNPVGQSKCVTCETSRVPSETAGVKQSFKVSDISETPKQKDNVQFGSTAVPVMVSEAFPATSGEGFSFNSMVPVTSTGSEGFKLVVPGVSSKPYEIEIVIQLKTAAANVPPAVHLPKSSFQFSCDAATSLVINISKMTTTTTTSVANTLTSNGFVGNASSLQPQCTITFQFGNKTDDIKTSCCAALSTQTTTVFTSNITSGGISSPSPFTFNSQPNKQFVSGETASVNIVVEPNREGTTQEPSVKLPSVPEVSSSNALGFPSSSTASQPTNSIFGSTNVTATTFTPLRFTSAATTQSSAADSTLNRSPMFTFGVPSSTEIKGPKPGFQNESPMSEEKPQVLPQFKFAFKAFKQDINNPVAISTSSTLPPAFMFGTSTSVPTSTAGFGFGAAKSDVSQPASSLFTFGGGIGSKPLKSSSWGDLWNQPFTVPDFTFRTASCNTTPVSEDFGVPNSNSSSLFTFGAKTTRAASNSIDNLAAISNPTPLFGRPLEQKQETQSCLRFGGSSSQTSVSMEYEPQEKRLEANPPLAGGCNFSLPEANPMGNSVSYKLIIPPHLNFRGITPSSTPCFHNTCANTSSGQSSGARKIRKAVRRGKHKHDKPQRDLELKHDEI